MTMTSMAVEASKVGKVYQINRAVESSSTLAEAAIKRIRRTRARNRTEEFHALHDITFSIGWGEAVGVLGRNGAGKSTLLKILTRITAPTRGRIVLGGRVGSLLEVGTGFHPELTGRENVYLNGTLLGMRRKEIRHRFDEIVAFAGVEQFLETQVKRYSTGMYVRLAFAVAAHLETEILAVDEVLAVGDAEFQAKCLTKMREVATEGRTVLLVSHQIQTVQEVCTSAIFLEGGRLQLHGSVEKALEAYRSSITSAGIEGLDPARRRGTGELRFDYVAPEEDNYEPAAEKRIEFRVATQPHFGRYYLLAHFLDADRNLIAQCDSRSLGRWFDASSQVEATLSLRHPWLKPGRYIVNAYLCQHGLVDAWEDACSFEVLPALPYPCATEQHDLEVGLVFADFTFD